MSFEFEDQGEWATAVEIINNTRKRAPWQMARLMLWGIENYCGSKGEVSDLYNDMSEQLEVSRKTLQNYVSVARRFPEEEVRERLEIGHHIAVVAQPEEIADYWLTKAEQNGWSVQKMRAEIRSASGTVDEEEGDEAEDDRYLVVKRLGKHGIRTQAEDNRITMYFPDGEGVDISSSSDLLWRIL